MPEEKPTSEQILHDALYHNRNLTLSQQALSNFLVRPFPPDFVDPTSNVVLNAIAGGSLEFAAGGAADSPYGSILNVLCIVGVEIALPQVPKVLLSTSNGDYWGEKTVDGGYTGELTAVAIEGDELFVGGADEEIQKLNKTSLALEQKNTGGSEELYWFKKIGTVWLAGGENGKILKSTDGGENWTDKSIGGANDLVACAYGKNKIVVVDTEGDIYYSTDLGESWTKVTMPLSPSMLACNLGEIIFDGNQFIICGPQIDGVTYWPSLWKSTNGTTWTVEFLLPGYFVEYPQGAAFGDGNYFLVGNGDGVAQGSARAWLSLDDAETWARKSVPLLHTPNGVHCVVYLSGAFHVLGEDHVGPLYCRSQLLY